MGRPAPLTAADGGLGERGRKSSARGSEKPLPPRLAPDPRACRRVARGVPLTVCSPGRSLAQNTYTNADKLLEAAEQLAQTGECDPEEIYQAAHQLEDRIQDFVRRVEQRKILLDMSVSFHTHVKEVRPREARRSPLLKGLNGVDHAWWRWEGAVVSEDRPGRRTRAVPGGEGAGPGCRRR